MQERYWDNFAKRIDETVAADPKNKDGVLILFEDRNKAKRYFGE